MQLVETTINGLKAPSSSNNQQVPQWKCHPPKHQMLSQVPQQQRKISRGLFSVHTSENKRPQQPTTSQQQAHKHHSDNDTGRSHCQQPTQGIMSSATPMTLTKSRTRLFSQHTNATNNKHNGTGRSHCQEPTQGIMIITSMSS